MGFFDFVKDVVSLEIFVKPLAEKAVDQAIDEQQKQQETIDNWNQAADDADQKAADEAAAYQNNLAALARGEGSINVALATEQEADAWVTGHISNLRDMDGQSQLTLEQRNMARELDFRFNYEWDVQDEHAYVIQAKMDAAVDESQTVVHQDDRVIASDRVDDSEQPADADDNRVGHTATDDISPAAPSLETAEDFYGTAGADPGGEEDEESFLEGWFSNLFSELTNNPNDALDNGDYDRSGGEKAVMIGGGALVGAIFGLVIGGAAGDKVNTTGSTALLTVSGGIAGLIASNN